MRPSLVMMNVPPAVLENCTTFPVVLDPMTVRTFAAAAGVALNVEADAETVFEPARTPYIVPTREVALTVEAAMVFEPARAPYIVPTREVAETVEAATVFEPARTP